MSQANAQFVAGNREELADHLIPFVQGSKRWEPDRVPADPDDGLYPDS